MQLQLFCGEFRFVSLFSQILGHYGCFVNLLTILLHFSSGNHFQIFIPPPLPSTRFPGKYPLLFAPAHGSIDTEIEVAVQFCNFL